MKIYTKTGDDGHTNLLYGGRVRKDDARPVAYGTVDELQAALGMARAQLDQVESPLAKLLTSIERDLYVVMAELATLPENRHKLQPGTSVATEEMTEALEQSIDRYSELFDPPTEFVLPGENLVSAHLDVARTIARRAERTSVEVAHPESSVLRYLNRLSDLLWVLARWQEGDSRLARDHEPQDSR
ncbi:MAG TPA: cob(I)yrinic acid a,c-diamide adenosyltransferase [Acidimicrobiia bacterium]|nr:cob(I)yrinic acid a,c-diamide adenosyltransferase [Acidimicrobiia bacterium]